MPVTVKTIGRAKVKVSEVNSAALNDEKAFFTLCNEKYEKKIDGIAKRIAENPAKARLIMLSGPSASGKTTTSLKIQEALKKRRCGAVTISMDDFFKNREDAPLLPDGTRDYESSEALDTELLKEKLGELIFKGRTALPVFDFKTGHRADGKHPVVLDEGQVAVVEGLHALDTCITGLLPAEFILKIYVSVSSDFITDEGGTVLCARDIRLIRRTVRDFNFRGADVNETLDMWDAVCRGEDLYVRPFKKYADITVNSAFSCEPCIFKEKALELFCGVSEDSPHIERVKHILDGINSLEAMSESLMPGSCVLREFMGGSEYY
ncbi:MAG TPA: nucleoside kinase [Ruminiclostridium sp.]|nr:nucleoside kinase [Ruminiclostridium sp.]